MYKKILGLSRLKKVGIPCPPYQVIDITGDKPTDVENYVLKKISQIGIPNIPGDRLGVTIRVSMPGPLDKLAKHGGLHVTEEKGILKRVLRKYQQYKPSGKIIVQHTVDAWCSGTVVKENGNIVIEAILGDAPPLLEGEVTNYERWVYGSKSRQWKKEKALTREDEQVEVLSAKDVEILGDYARRLAGNVYLEWSMAKNGKLYFYEYYELKSTA